MKYFVEFHFSQVPDAWAIPLRELRERHAAVDAIVNGPDDGAEEMAAMDALVARLQKQYGR